MGGIPTEQYVGWFSPIAKEIKRVIKPTGSFFLNIKPHTEQGERSLYVFDLVLHLKRELGFLFVDEFCWSKNPYPGKFSGRFKNAFEPIYHFTKENPTKITFNPAACSTVAKEEKRIFREGIDKPDNGSGMTKTRMNFVGIKNALPSNLVHINPQLDKDKKSHPATFPEKLAEFFILSFTNEDDVVLDPFAGSGTVGVAAKQLNRKYVLIERQPEYVQLINRRLNNGIVLR